MVNSQNIEIKLSKLKLALMFFGSILFVITGILFVNNPTKYVSFIMRSPSFIFIAGCCAILFFGITGFFLLRKILDNRPGLILSDKGVMENAMYVSIGFIPWQDIIKLEHTKIVNQMFISIIVRNPEEYIKKQRSFFKRKIMRENYKKFGTPIGISANGLKINYADLTALIEKKFSEFKRESR